MPSRSHVPACPSRSVTSAPTTLQQPPHKPTHRPSERTRSRSSFRSSSFSRIRSISAQPCMAQQAQQAGGGGGGPRVGWGRRAGARLAPDCHGPAHSGRAVHMGGGRLGSVRRPSQRRHTGSTGGAGRPGGRRQVGRRGRRALRSQMPPLRSKAPPRAPPSRDSRPCMAGMCVCEGVGGGGTGRGRERCLQLAGAEQGRSDSMELPLMVRQRQLRNGGHGSRQAAQLPRRGGPSRAPHVKGAPRLAQRFDRLLPLLHQLRHQSLGCAGGLGPQGRVG